MASIMDCGSSILTRLVTESCLQRNLSGRIFNRFFCNCLPQAPAVRGATEGLHPSSVQASHFSSTLFASFALRSNLPVLASQSMGIISSRLCFSLQPQPCPVTQHASISSAAILLFQVSHSSSCMKGLAISSLPSTGEMTTRRVPRATIRPSLRYRVFPSSSEQD